MQSPIIKKQKKYKLKIVESFSKKKTIDYYKNKYDATKLTINKYIELLDYNFDINITNINKSSIPLEERKKGAFGVLLEYILKLDDEKIKKWENIFEILFNEKKEKKEEKCKKDLSHFNIGEDVIYYTTYKGDDGRDYKVNVKCRIIKINKSSLTLQKYKCEIDDSERPIAMQQQTWGYTRFIWKDELNNLEKKVIVKNVDEIMRKGASLYDDYIKMTRRGFDYGI